MLFTFFDFADKSFVFCLLFYVCSLRLNLPVTCTCFLAVHSFRCNRSKWWWQYNLCTFQALQARPLSMALSRCGAGAKNEPSYFPLCVAVLIFLPPFLIFFPPFLIFSLSLRSCNSSFSAALSLCSRLYLIVYNAFFGATFRRRHFDV